MARFGRGIRSLVLAALLAAVFLPSAARAACTSPTGIAGDITYNGDYHVLQYCNNVRWVAMTTTVNLPTTNGLVGYWKLDDGAGTSAIDSSGYGITGTTHNSPTWTTGGYYNGALDFGEGGATNQNVTFSNLPAGTPSMTISVWANVRSITGRITFILKGTSYYRNGSEWSLAMDAGTGTLETSMNGSTQYGAAGDVITGSWHLYTVTITSSAVNFYRDGALLHSAGGLTEAAMGSTSEIMGGCGNTDCWVDGLLDDIRVYNRALSAAEVATIYNWHVSPQSSGLVGWWRFDESAGTVAADSSGNSHTGTLTNGPTFTSAGKLAGALSFDGVDDYVSLAGLATGSYFTYSAWIKPNAQASTYGGLFTQGASAGLWFRGTSAGASNRKIDYYYSGADHHNTTALTDGQWQHIAVTNNNGSVAFYLNGSPNGTASGAPSFSADAMGNDYLLEAFKGALDDVRIYNRALSADEIYGLYRTGSPVCASPSGYEGTYIYNSDFHVLQFCDNASWRPLGPVPGSGGAGCSNPAGGEKDMIYNKDNGVMQYCDGTKWIAMGPPVPKIYLADTTNSKIVKFDSGGNYLGSFGSAGSGNGQVGFPYAVAVDGSGNVYVAEGSNNRIEKFDANGNYVSKFGSGGAGNGQFSYAGGIAFDPSGNIWVADLLNHRIQKFDSSGNYLLQAGSSGSGNGQFTTMPGGIGVDSSGNVYVSDYNGAGSITRVQKFDSSGNYLLQFGSYGAGNGQFNIATGIFVDKNNNVWVADDYNGRVQEFDSSGNYINKVGGYCLAEGGTGCLYAVVSVAVDNDGNVYFYSEYDTNDGIVKFDKNGNYLLKTGSSHFGQNMVNSLGFDNR